MTDELKEKLEEKYRKFLETEFTVFDLETSGLYPDKDEILEIAGIKMKGPQEIARFEILIQPTRPIPPEVEKIHGLNELFLLVNGKKSKDAMSEFFAFIGDSIVVGHNIKDFDWLFVLSHAKKHVLPLPKNAQIDTLHLSRQLLALPRYNLTEVARHFGHENRNAHRAMPDVEVNAKVFVELMNKMFAQVR
ncbi:MAG: 3'-5' exonuclease [Candidatus Buchananbacteria bacterium]|jgi:DNA polymerase III epsilon subunit family exonuclease